MRAPVPSSSPASPDGTVHYTGGLGWKFGDPGDSDFDLRPTRCSGALPCSNFGFHGEPLSDVRPSPLAEALVNHTGLMDYAANSRFFYTDPAANATIASFAPRVLALAEEECGAAQQVVADSLTELARLADGVIHQYFPNATAKLPCGVSGKILNSVAGTYALRSLANKLDWPVELHFITTPPIEGVRRLLVEDGSQEPVYRRPFELSPRLPASSPKTDACPPSHGSSRRSAEWLARRAA